MSTSAEACCTVNTRAHTELITREGDALGSTQTWHHTMTTTKTWTQRLPPRPFVFLCTMEDICDIEGGSEEVWHACCDEVLIHIQQLAAITRWRKSSLQKTIHRADGNKSPQSNKNAHVKLLVRVPQLGLTLQTSLPLSVCRHFPFCVYPPSTPLL